MESYVECKSEEFAAIAREDLAYERTATRRSRALFEEFAADPAQGPLVRQVLNRWLVISLLALGRPGTAGDRRAIELGLRTRSCSDSIVEYLRRLDPLMQVSGLGRSELEAAGVELPRR